MKALRGDPLTNTMRLDMHNRRFAALDGRLEALEKLLESVPGLLKANGRVAMISFHSLEDRLVKQNFKKNAANGIYNIITKKPLVAGRDEIAENPRPRSAKLRIAEKR